MPHTLPHDSQKTGIVRQEKCSYFENWMIGTYQVTSAFARTYISCFAENGSEGTALQPGNPGRNDRARP